jgi:hypothetical protein
MDIFKTLLLDTPIVTQTAGSVTSVFGRSGDVTAANGDYTASNITNIAAGSIAATDVQAAVNELDSEKMAKSANLSDVSSVVTARSNLLPSYTGNGNKVLSLNSGETDVEWTTNGAGTVTSVDLTAGTGISVSGGPITSSGNITVTNTAPDQTVALTGGTGISVTGTYPSFTVTNSSPSLGGDVVGPASATDNAVVRFDSTTGKLIQNSGVSISDANLLTTTALTVNDNTTLGSSNADTVTFNARSASEFTPATDNTYDLGRTGHEWRDLYINGTANIDSLVADTADVNGGTIDGTTVGATTPSTGAFTTLSATGKFTAGSSTFVAGDGSIYVDGATGLTIVGKAGSSTDLTIAAANGQNLCTNPTGTSNVVIGNGSGTITAANSLSVTGALSTQPSGTTNPVGFGATSTYGTLSFNNQFTTSTTIGIQGGGGVDNTMYYVVPTGGGHSHYVNGSLISTISSTGLAVTGALSCTGALSKGSGSFRIEHPLPSKSATHELVHSFIEGPKCDLIYRGKIDLVDGKATVNIDTDSTMTEGTFEALCATVQCFTSNESGWGAIRGKVVGNILTIEAQDAASTDSVSWMVIGERKDPHIMDTDWTDENGRPIVESLKPLVESK